MTCGDTAVAALSNLRRGPSARPDLPHPVPPLPEVPCEPFFLWREALLVTILLAAQLAGSNARAGSMILLALWALRSSRAAIQALSLSILVLCFNSELTPPGPFLFTIRWSVLLCAAARAGVDALIGPLKSVSGFYSLAAFVAVSLLLSISVAGDLVLSLFKLAAFAIGAATALALFSTQRDRLDYWINWFYTTSCVLLWLGLPLLFHPAGYAVAAWAYQGLLLHPQTFAVYFVPITAYLLVRIILHRESRLFVLATAAVAVYSISRTSSRTAVTAALLGLGAVILVVPFRGGVLRGLSPRSFAIRSGAVLVSLALIGAYARESAIAAIGSFAVKYRNETAGELLPAMQRSILASRGHQISVQIDTIAQRPFAGAGFGLSALGVQQVVERSETTGLPVSAPVEQGFFPLSVLAQVGVIGAVPLLILLAVLFSPVARYASVPVMVFCGVSFFTNFGEMTFFSTAGLGMQMWLILAWCHQKGLRERLERVYADRFLAQYRQSAPVRPDSCHFRPAGYQRYGSRAE